MTVNEAKAQFVATAQAQGVKVLYAGTWDTCPAEAMAVWTQAAQRRAAQQYGPVGAGLARRIHIKE